jgi:hypothetical protein
MSHGGEEEKGQVRTDLQNFAYGAPGQVSRGPVSHGEHSFSFLLG